ncbi:MAG: UvrD-helicase domain-containing protein [Methylophilus sp.]|uniref:UvrD-helicase domain-containing protein n=1 Tax=Methylophilus sp. TaxID=29541 RepID=UPI003F9F1034
MSVTMQDNDLQQALASDTANRQRALDIESFIVEAPAGAGKTELLTQRVLKLLQTVQAPEEIIAITFTNKAASEMRARILDSLQLAAAGVLPEAPHKQITFELGLQALKRSAELNWHLLETPARLRIYTIDSLCANLARQMPLLSRFGTQPAVTEDAWAYYREAAGQALQTMDEATLGEPVRLVLRYMDNDQTRLEGLLMAMLSKREQWLHLSQTGNQTDAARLALLHLIESELQQAAQALPARLQAALMPIARYAASQLPPDHTMSALLDWQQPYSASIEDLPGWRALTELLLTASGGLRKRLDKNMGLPATEEAKPYKEALTEILDGLAQHSDSDSEASIARIRMLPDPDNEDDAMIQALSQLLNIAAAQLWLCFQAQNEVDFVEIAQRALAALVEGGVSTELAMRLDYRIQHLLVDEFQDTSPMQIDLLKALTRGWLPGDGRTLFAVGDPMQSIYRFRKANVGLFLNVAVYGIGDILLTSLKLWRNNRSRPQVVDWINQTFKGMLPARDAPQQGAIAYRPFVATRAEAEGAGVFVHPLLIPVAEADDEPADIRHLEAEQIIRIIQQTRAHKPDATIAVLVRARRHLHALVSEMRRNHSELSFQAVEIEELANRQIVQDLLTLTYALHQRADRVHWLALLRAPWCGLTLADLHALIGQDSHRSVMHLLSDEAVLARLSDDGQQRARHLREVMHSALEWRGRASVSRWVHNTWLRLGGAQCLWNENDVQDVQAFFSRIAALEQHNQFNPQALAEDVKKLYAAPDAKADASLQFMTIHKSKGLEFDTVILPGLDGGNPPDDAKLVIWEEVTLAHGTTELVAAPYVPAARKRQQAALGKTAVVTAYDYLNDLDKTRAAYEDARVLYVAATRAERQLHLLGAAKADKNGDPQPRKNTFLHLLWPAVSTWFTTEHDLVARAPLAQTDADIRQFVPQLIRVRQAETPAVLQVSGTLAAASHHQQTEDAPVAALEADTGTLAHLYLQLIAGQGIDRWAESVKNQFLMHAPAMQRWLKQRGYAENEATLGAAKAASLLTTTLSSTDGQWVLEPHAQAASELAIEQLADSKKVIDRTFIADGVRWIIDYKSMPVTSQQDLKALAAYFKPQLTAYAQLFQQESLPIKTAILFLSIGKLVTID